MANASVGAVRLIDSSGDPLDNDAGELQVVINAASAINIGDVDLEFNGTAASVNTGSMDAGTLRVTLADDDPAVAKLGTIDTDTGNIATILTAIDGDTSNLPSIKTAVQKIDNVIYDDDSAFTLGSSDIVAIGGFAGTQTITSNQIGALSCTTGGALYTTHNITGILSDDNPTVGTSAEAITTDGADGAAACKRMDIMSHPSNTGEIWVGDAAVTTNGANGGIRLLPGDVYSIDIDNTGDVYVVATVDGENVSYNYFT